MSDAEICPVDNNHLSAGGENGHRVNGQLSNETQISDSLPTGKSANYQKTKDGRSQQQIDRSERLKLIKEKQNEEQQKKLEELKQQALAAQKFRERSEEERRRRIESLRNREMDKRQQVEERKRLIMEAERDRMEAILRRNQEREARLESKRRMERSSVFAFGSSTPRMLEPTEGGSTYWASRRATSTTNVMSMSVACPGPLTRRSSERELTNNNKKRATSAGGLIDRKNVDDCRPRDSICNVLYWDNVNYHPLYSETPSFKTIVHYPSTSSNKNHILFGEGKENNVVDAGTTLSAQPSAARRKTDLMPTVPASRDTAAVAASRNSSTSVCSSTRRSPGSRSGETTPRPPSAHSQYSCSSSVASSTARPRSANTSLHKARPKSVEIAGVTTMADGLRSGHSGRTPLCEIRTVVPKVNVTKKSTPKIDAGRKTDKQKSPKTSPSSTTPKDTPLQSPTIELSTESSFSASESGEHSNIAVAAMTTSTSKVVDSGKSVSGASSNEILSTNSTTTDQKSDCSAFSDNDSAECDIMTGSMTSSQIRRITTEKEAKAALAERRRLAREQAEREAELEQQRLEAERRAEEERLRKEEEEQRRMEEEQLRLIEEAKKAEEERLLQAIEETKKREEEERLRKEEEQRLKLEKEEASRKQKEETERVRQEMELKLKKEEEERLARKKRVEAIMNKMRKGGTPAATPTKENNGDMIEGKMNGVINKVISDNDNTDRKNENDSHFTTVQPSSDNNNGNIMADTLNHEQNGIHHAVDSHHVTNNNLLDLTDFDVINTNKMSDPAVSPQILDLQVGKDNYNSNKQDLSDLLS